MHVKTVEIQTSSRCLNRCKVHQPFNTTDLQWREARTRDTSNEFMTITIRLPLPHDLVGRDNQEVKRGRGTMWLIFSTLFLIRRDTDTKNLQQLSKHCEFRILKSSRNVNQVEARSKEKAVEKLSQFGTEAIKQRVTKVEHDDFPLKKELELGDFDF
ncbi:hypothetical protein TNCV_4191401 [Trichonephila clavipes]|nr:hypothetical protein TNCV_4191401 [Trichonephila clavipes]